MLLSVDVETECAMGCTTSCECALDSFRNRVTVIGVVTETGERHVFRRVEDFVSYLGTLPTFRLLGHGFKFDARTFHCHGLDLLDAWEEDSHLMATVCTDKVPDSYLAWYETERRKLNSILGGEEEEHRKGRKHSLKTLAPYFLGKEPFWEVADKDNDEYVLTDCQYALDLYQFLRAKLEEQGSYDFYKEKLLPWTKLLVRAELRGITLDFGQMTTEEGRASKEAAEAKQKLDSMWADAYEVYHGKQEIDLWETHYGPKQDAAISKLKELTAEKVERTKARYQALYEKACANIQPLNLDSPAQLTWLLRDYLKLDIQDFDGEETTGKAVLQKLAGQGRDDVREFLRYRENTKLSQAFFPSYREMAVNGVLHCRFNPGGTRTGRLSSADPNLQQVPGELHHLFVARPGYKLATYDMSAIEPRLIAYYTHDLNLVDIVQQGKDFHAATTSVLFGLDPETPNFKKRYALEREVGKEVGLLIMYGGGYRRIMESGQKRGFVWSKREAQHRLARFKEYYEGVFKFREEAINPVLLDGGVVTNLLGRPLSIPDPENVHLQGMNSLVQGSASDLVLNSAHRITKEFEARGIGGHVLLLVHDEIVTEIPEEREAECVEIITRCMTDYQLDTPLGRIPLKVEGCVASCWQKG